MVALSTPFAPSSGKDASGDTYMCSLEGPPPPGFAYADDARWAVDEAMAAGGDESALCPTTGA